MSEAPDALRLVPVNARDLDALRYVLNRADEASRIRTVMSTFTLPERETTAERLERLYATLRAAAPAVQPAAGREEIVEAIKTAMTDAWCDITSDTGCWPADLKRVSPRGPVRLEYHPAIWTEMTAQWAADRILAAISTPAQASGEPVAWRYRWKPTPRSQPGEWREPTNIRWGEEDRTGFEEQPLYAHPTAQASETGGEVQTLRVLLDNLVIAQSLSRELRQLATDQARSYLYQLRQAALSAPQAAPGEGEQS